MAIDIIDPDAATVRFSDIVNRQFTVDEFFRAWGYTLDSVHIGRFFVSRRSPLTMTVNGTGVTDFQNHRIVGGDKIEIRYG